MEYAIQELAALAGVTTRTLRWYDRIGLLKPSRTAENGYRYYGPAEVNRLQDIMYYRALGVELSRIKEYLDAPSFDRLGALRSHLTALQGERQRLEQLIQSVEETIDAEEKGETMKDEKKFEAFKQRTVEENEQKYGREVRERYGDAAADRANAALMNQTPEQYAEWKALEQEILCKLEAAVSETADPKDEKGRELTALHRRWLILSMGHCDAARQKGIAELYVLDERFTAYYDRAVSGCAAFLRDSVRAWA